MVPAVPSAVMVWPSLMREVATLVPMTAGIWYSRATMAVCDRMPPWSVTTPEAMANRGVHGGIVAGQTRISPWLRRAAAARDMMTRAVAVTFPAGAAVA